MRLDLGDKGISMLQGVPVAAAAPTPSSSSSGGSSSPQSSPSTSASTDKPLPFLNTDDFFVMKASSECK